MDMRRTDTASRANSGAAGGSVTEDGTIESTERNLKATTINFQFLAHAVLSTDEVLERMHPMAS